MDIGFDTPYYWHTVPEAEREARTELTSDLCSIDGEDFFIRGLLQIPLVDMEDDFAWGLWMSVSEANYRRYIETFDWKEQSQVGSFTGWISNQIRGYPNMLELVVRADLQDNNQRPLLVLKPTDHPLAIEQHRGITFERLSEIIGPYLHAQE